jgi:enoyl-CoA hydratase/carnithine racemase
VSEFVRESVESGVQILCLNRPHKKNAVTIDMYQALSDALHKAEADPSIKVTLIHGEGADFSSGNDINEFVQIAQAPEKMSPVMAFLQTLTIYKKPLIAGVEGRAVGVGATMLLHCDMVLAARDSRFQFPFVQLGLVPEAASSHLLPLLIGHQKAFEKLILGEVFGSEEALEMGMLNHLCESGEAFDMALAYANKIAALPVEAVTLSKDLLKYRAQDDIQMALMREGRIFKDRLASAEARQAFMAFLSRGKT